MGIILITDVVVSADIMTTDSTKKSFFETEAIKENDGIIRTAEGLSKSSLNNNKSVRVIQKNSPYLAGDTVYYSSDQKNYSEYVVKNYDNELVILEAINPEIKNKLVFRDVFLFIKEFKTDGLKNGDTFTFEFVNTYNASEKAIAKVLGFCNELVLLKTDSGFSVSPLSKIIKK